MKNTIQFKSYAHSFKSFLKRIKRIKRIKRKKKYNKMKKQIPKKIRQLVWNKYIGEKFGAGICQCCKITEITQMNFHCGHITSEKNGGDMTLTNLLPICALCNSSMGSINMWDFIKTHGLHRDDTLNLKEEIKRLTKLLEEAEERIVVLQKNVMDQHEQNRRLVMSYEG